MGSIQSTQSPDSNTIPETPSTKQRKFSGKTAKKKHLFGFGRRSEEFFNVVSPCTADSIKDETKATQSNAEDASLNSLAQISPSKPVSPSAPATHTSTLPAATQSVVLHQCSSHEALDNQTTVEVQKDLNWSENHFPNDLPSQKQVFGDQFDAIRDQLLVETDSWRTAKRWTTATAIKGSHLLDRSNDISSNSCSDSEFVSPTSPADIRSYCSHKNPISLLKNLSITKLELSSYVDSVGQQEKLKHLQVSTNAQISFVGEPEEFDLPDLPALPEMPIVRHKVAPAVSGHQRTRDESRDKSIFNVSRVKKVELNEISANKPSNINLSIDPTQQSQNNQNTPNATTPMKTPNSTVMHRVISLTATHADNLQKIARPKCVPEKLQFSACEKFEGQMLMNWLAQSFQSLTNSLSASLSDNDMNIVNLQYCTNLLVAGIIKQLDDKQDIFKPNLMYMWTHTESPSPAPLTPGKLETLIVWPHSDKKHLTSAPGRLRIDGESKIPKLLSSTPKPRLQLNSDSMSSSASSNNSSATTMNANNKMNELKCKLHKCEKVEDMLLMIKSFLKEYSINSSTSTVIGAENGSKDVFSNSLLNSSDVTIFDSLNNSEEITVFKQQKLQTTPKSRKARVSSAPSTPTSSHTLDSKRIRRNLSTESTPNAFVEVNTSNFCKKCQKSLQVTPVQTDPAPEETVSEPIKEPLLVTEKISMETQTDFAENEPEINEEILKVIEKVEIKEPEVVNIPLPPPPPPMMMRPIPAPPPMMMPPPPPPPFGMMPKLGPGPSMPIAPIGPGKFQSSAAPSATTSSLATKVNPPNPPSLPTPPALSSEWYQTNILRKNPKNPPKAMKPLYWTRIVTPVKNASEIPPPEDLTDHPEEKSASPEVLWQEIDETSLDNLDEFTELFSRQGVLPKAKEKTEVVKMKTIKTLDPKRSQNVAILYKSIHMNFAEIEHAICYCETAVINVETLQHIQEIKATPDELALINDAVQNNPNIPLDAPEDFLLKLSQISSSFERISCIVFQGEFDEQCSQVSRKLQIVRSLSDFMLENENLKQLFSIILTLGNYMNGGNRQRGQADGFGLEILGKLRDVKSKDSKITLLHFIVQTYIAGRRKSGQALCDLELPIPDANEIDKSVTIDFEEIKQQLTALKTKIAECKRITAKVVENDSNAANTRPFQDKMDSFIEMATERINSRFVKLDDCKVLFYKTLKFYKFLPKSGCLEDTTPGQFFECWVAFCNDFHAIWKKEVQILTNELLKKTKQVSKPQSKPTSSTANNLKSRINKLRNRDK